MPESFFARNLGRSKLIIITSKARSDPGNHPADPQSGWFRNEAVAAHEIAVADHEVRRRFDRENRGRGNLNARLG